MTIDTDTIMSVLTDILGDRQIQITAKQSLKGAVITGCTTFVGGLLAGPIGLAVGGATGGAIAAFATSGTFMSVRRALEQLPDDRKYKIAIQIESVTKKLAITDLIEFSKLALMATTITQANADNVLIQAFIRESIGVIQREILEYNNVNNALN